MSKLSVYFVQIGMDGYLPDSVSAYPTLASAVEAAKREKSDILDGSMDSGMKVRGNIRDNWSYEVLSEGKYYHTSIRIETESASIVDYMPDWYPGRIKTRVDLESFCDWYNEQCF